MNLVRCSYRAMSSKSVRSGHVGGGRLSSSAPATGTAASTAVVTVRPTNSKSSVQRRESNTQGTPRDVKAAAVHASGQVTSTRVVGSRVTPAAPVRAASERQRTKSTVAVPSRASTVSASQRAPVERTADGSHTPPPPRRGGRTAESPADRLSRVLAEREKRVAEIYGRVSRQPSSKQWESLSPLEQLLPSPPEWLIHQLALQWMGHTAATAASPRRSMASVRGVRQAFSRGTELQLLCAMAGLPVLPSTESTTPLMAGYLHSAVRVYADQNPHIFTTTAVSRGIQWDGDCAIMTVSTRLAIDRAKQYAINRARRTTSDTCITENDTCITESDTCITSDAVVDEIASSTVPSVGPLPPIQSPGEECDPSQDSIYLPASPSIDDDAAACPAQATQEIIVSALDTEAGGEGVEPICDAAGGDPSVAAAPAEIVPAESPLYVLQSLQPGSSVAVVELTRSRAYPTWLASAVRALQPPGGRMPTLADLKQRLIIAAAAAQELHALMESRTDADIAKQFGFSARRLLQDPSGTDLLLGNGVCSSALKLTCKPLKLTAPVNTERYAQVDAAQRIILRQLWSGCLNEKEVTLAWIDALKRLATEGPPTQMPALLDALRDQPSVPVEPVYTPVAGDGHCWYACVALAESQTQEEIQAAITAALRKQSTAPPACLALVKLIDSDSDLIDVVDQASAKRALQVSLQTKRLRDRHYAGDPEMILYSMATKGAARFLVFSSIDVRVKWASPRVQIFQSPRSNPTREIVLHLCTLSGREGTGLTGTPAAAHYNVLLAKLPDGCTRGYWNVDPHETEPQRERRHALLWEQCKAAVFDNAIRWKTIRRLEDESSTRYIRTLFGTGDIDPSARHAFRPVKQMGQPVAPIAAADSSNSSSGQQTNAMPADAASRPTSSRAAAHNASAFIAATLCELPSTPTGANSSPVPLTQEIEAMMLAQAESADAEISAVTALPIPSKNHLIISSTTAALSLPLSGVAMCFTPPGSPPRRSSSATRADGSRRGSGRRSAAGSVTSPSRGRPLPRTHTPVGTVVRKILSPPRSQSARPYRTGHGVSFDPELGPSPHSHSPTNDIAGAVTAATNSGADWRQHRSTVLADLDPSTVSLFIAAIDVLLEDYRKHSEARDWTRCAVLLHALINYPAQAMRSGTHKAKLTFFRQAEASVRAAVDSLGHLAPTAITAAVAVPAAVTTSMPARTEAPLAEASPVSYAAAVAAATCTAIDSASPLNPGAEGRTASQAPASEAAESPPVASAEASSATIAASNAHSTTRIVIDERQRTLNVRRARTILRHRGPRALTRAAKALQSLPRAPINEATLAELRRLHPAARQLMGGLPLDLTADLISLEKVLGRAVKRCNNGSSPGLSGWTGEHLALIYQRCNKGAVQGLHLLIRDLCNGVFLGDADLHRRLQACCLAPLYKDNGGIRPIAIMEVFTKCAAHCAVLLIEDQLPRLFPRIQYGVKRAGGSETAAHLLRQLLLKHSTDTPGQAALLELGSNHRLR